MPDAQALLASSPLHSIPYLRGEIDAPMTLETSPWALVLAVAAALYGGLGACNALQHTMNVVWAVPRNSRPNPFATRARSLALLGLLILSFGVIHAILTTTFQVAGLQGGAGMVVGLGLSVLAVSALFVIAIRVATAATLGVRQVLPGALVAALTWIALQQSAFSWFSGWGDSLSARRVVLVVLGLVGALHLAALAIVMGTELNVVLARRLHPRALLTPFTDRVDLTEADVASYTAQARAQRFKGQETISVEFGARPGRVPPRPRRFSRRA